MMRASKFTSIAKVAKPSRYSVFFETPVAFVVRTLDPMSEAR